jgi:short-subunit dehydrogenase
MKNILITGASRGIGKALVASYLNKNNRVFAIARNTENLSVLKHQFQQQLEFTTCDVSEPNQVRNAFSLAENYLNKVDIAILNAGISGSEGFDNFLSEKFIKIYKTNLFGVVYFFEHLIPHFKNNGGGVLAAVSSLADVRGFPGSAAYSSSKVALTHTLEAARAELSKFNIRVVTIRPGFVRTDMTAKNRFPMPFMIEPEKAAEIILNGIERGNLRINFPLPTYLLTNLIKFMPDGLYDFIMRNYKVRIDD